jgi:hypothetical protein
MPSVYPNVNSNYRTNCQPAYAGGSTVIGGSGTSFGGGGAGIAIGGGAVAIGGGVGIAAGGGAIAIGGAGVGAGLGGVGAGFGNGNYGVGSLGVGGSSSTGGSTNSSLPGASSSSDSGTGPIRLPIPHCLTHAVDMLTCELCLRSAISSVPTITDVIWPLSIRAAGKNNLQNLNLNRFADHPSLHLLEDAGNWVRTA